MDVAYMDVMESKRTKSDLLVPGAYESYPQQLLEGNLSSNAIVLVLRMLQTFRRNDDAVYVASQVELADLMGASKNTLRSTIEELEQAGIFTIEKRTGGRSRYSFRPAAEWFTAHGDQAGQNMATKQPETPNSKPPGRVKNCTGANNEPGQKLTQTGSKIEPHRVKNCTTALCSTRGALSTATDTPPTPPGGGSEQISGPAGNNGDETSPEATVDAAYREAMGVGMPANWRRRIRRECEHGDASLFSHVTDATIRRAMQMAEQAGGTFGFGWVMKAAAQATMRKNTATRKQPETPQPDAAANSEERRKKQQERDLLAWFDRLPDDTQARYLADEDNSRFSVPPRVRRFAAAQAAHQDLADASQRATA